MVNDIYYFYPVQLTKEAYLKGLLDSNQTVITTIYREFLPGVITYIKKNQGDVDEAKDTFQDALLIIYDKAQQAEFKLTEGFGNYLFGVCRFIWWRQLKKKQREPITLVEENAQVIDNSWEQLQLAEEKQRLYRDVFVRLGHDCQEVLQRFFNGESLAAIAEQMGYSSSYAKLKKFQCKERLTKWIKADRRYQELKES